MSRTPTSGEELLVAGVDGGGSGTRALVTDGTGRERARGEGPPGRIDPGRPEAAAEAVAEAVRGTGVGAPLAALWAGLAGAGDAGARTGVEERLRVLGLAERVGVGTDLEAARRDAFGPGPGILVVAGTGSAVVARDEGGREVRVGGWGGRFGDEGGGYWIGVESVGAVLRAEDDRASPTDLRERLFRALGVDDARALAAAGEKAPRDRIAALAEAVASAAAEGDPVAASILERAAAELAEQVRVAVERLGAPGEVASAAAELPVALAGGLLGAGTPLRARLTEMLEARGARVRRDEVRGDRGAVALARALIACVPPPE